MSTATVSPERYRRLANWAIISLGAIVLAGAAVRLTGSGLGCDDWPTCEDGSLVPASGSLHSAIEFANRAFSVVPAAAAIGVVWGANRRRPERSDLKRWSWAIVAGIVAQILVGAVVVRSDLLPSAVIIHFLLSMILLWTAVVLRDRARSDFESPAQPRVPPTLVNLGRGAVLVATYVLVTGTIVTGSGPHSGDADDPERLRYFLPDVARLHSSGVIVLVALTLGAAIWAWPRPADDPIRRAALLLFGIVAVQGALGYIQYFSGVPAGLVLIHVLGSILVWIAVLRFHFSLFERVEQPTGSLGTREPALTP